METIEALLTRKSVRSFKNQEVDEETINTLLKAAMAAPSAVNRQPWVFYVCKSQEVKNAVIKAMPFGKYKSPIIIVPCIDESRAIPFMHDLVNCDLSAATENILLAAHALGLGAVWCAVYPDKKREKDIATAIKCKKGETPFSAIYIGFPDDEDKSKVKDKYNPKNVVII